MKLHKFKIEWLKRIRRAKCPCLIVGPTGCGKTVIAAQLMLRRRVLFVAHTRELIAQAVKRCLEWGIPADDVGVILGGGRFEGEDHLVEDASRRVQIASKQTLSRRDWPSVDVVIFDEAHHVPSEGWAKIFRHYEQAGVKIYGLTATPIRLDQRELGEYFVSLVQAPPTTELAKQGHIVVPRVWVPKDGRPDLREAKVNKRDFETRELSRVMRRRTIVGSLVEHWKKLGGGQQTVVYAVDVKHAEVIASRFKRVGVEAQLLTGSTPIQERNDLLKRFNSGSLKVIVNVQVLTEGWDAPAAKCIVLARPTMSLGLVMQMVGRGTRPKNGSEARVLDLVGNFPHFSNAGYDLIGDNVFELNKGKVAAKTGDRRYKVCPECEELCLIGARVCECGHEFWAKGAPPENPGELEEWFPPSTPTGKELETAIRMYISGHGCPMIASKLGTTPHRVLTALIRSGTRIRSQDARPLKLDACGGEEAVKLYTEGHPASSIAARLGVDPKTVALYLRKNGVRIRRNYGASRYHKRGKGSEVAPVA